LRDSPGERVRTLRVGEGKGSKRGGMSAAEIQLESADARIGFTPATNAVTLPEPEPRAVREALVVLTIGSRQIACGRRPFVRQREDPFQVLDVSDRSVDVHCVNAAGPPYQHTRIRGGFVTLAVFARLNIPAITHHLRSNDSST